MKMGKNNDQQWEMRIQYIPMGKIDIPSGQPKFGNPTARVASIQRVGLQQPSLVTRRGSRYRLIDGESRYHAYARLGWATIPARILWVDDQHAELIAIDANLMREERTPSESRELRQRRQDICRAICRQNKHRKGPGPAQKKEEQSEASTPATDTPATTERAPRTIQPPLPSAIDEYNNEGGGKGRSANLAPRAFIPRLIKSLPGIQDTQQSPPAPTNHQPKNLSQGSARGGKVAHKMGRARRHLLDLVTGERQIDRRVVR